MTLLREPRLNLLSKHAVSLKDPAGEVVATIGVTLPLDDRITMDDVAINIGAHVDKAFLGDVVAGHDLSGGALDVAANDDGLTVKGQAILTGIPVSLDAAMDFRAGPPTQVLQRVTVTGRPDARQLAAAGLDATDLLAGPVDLQAVLTEQRNGSGNVSVDAGLTGATLTVAPLDWRKPPGRRRARDGATAAAARPAGRHRRDRGRRRWPAAARRRGLRWRPDFAGPAGPADARPHRGAGNGAASRLAARGADRGPA